MSTRFAPGLYRDVEHTADLGFEVEAPSAAALFERAGLALFAHMVALEGVEPREGSTVEIEGAAGWEEMLHDWLAKLLVCFQCDGLVGVEIDVRRLGKGCVSGEVRGERFDASRHRFYSEIKGVTYHQLSVRGGADGWWARVILDV